MFDNSRNNPSHRGLYFCNVRSYAIGQPHLSSLLRRRPLWIFSSSLVESDNTLIQILYIAPTAYGKLALHSHVLVTYPTCATWLRQSLIYTLSPLSGFPKDITLTPKYPVKHQRCIPDGNPVLNITTMIS